MSPPMSQRAACHFMDIERACIETLRRNAPQSLAKGEDMPPKVGQRATAEDVERLEEFAREWKEPLYLPKSFGPLARAYRALAMPLCAQLPDGLRRQHTLRTLRHSRDIAIVHFIERERAAAEGQRAPVEDVEPREGSPREWDELLHIPASFVPMATGYRALVVSLCAQLPDGLRRHEALCALRHSRDSAIVHFIERERAAAESQCTPAEDVDKLNAVVLEWFTPEGLPVAFLPLATAYHTLAVTLCAELPDSRLRHDALRTLLHSRDTAMVPFLAAEHTKEAS